MCAADKVLTLYHGSKAGLEGPIGLKTGRNRTACDFGCGFYMGDEPTQPRTLICDGMRREGEGFRDLVRRYAGKESGR